MNRNITHFMLIFTAVAFGQGKPEAPKHRAQEQGRDKMRALEFWKQADINHDQKLSKEEFLQLPRISPLPAEKQDKLFTHLDKDKNSSLEPAEMIPPNAPVNPGSPATPDGKRRMFPRIAEMDRDGDRKITFDEFEQATMGTKLPEDRRRKIFDNMDRNQDGALSPEDGPPQGQGPRRPDARQDGRPDRMPTPSPARGFGAVDTNQDQKIDFPELQQFPMVRQQSEDSQEDLFEKIDVNRDLRIDAQEWQKHWENHPPGSLKPTERPAKPQPAHPKSGSDEMMDDQMMENGI
ncbi:MAG: EF-hand domain-containing protein [Akkermansiaceae bacterium]